MFHSQVEPAPRESSSKRVSSILLLIAASLMVAPVGSAADIDSPDTYGTACITIKEHTAVGGTATLTYLALQFNEPRVAEGTVTGATSNGGGGGEPTLTDSSAGFGVFPTDEYYVLLSTGANAGARATIKSNTATELTLQSTPIGLCLTPPTFRHRPSSTAPRSIPPSQALFSREPFSWP